jgi:hypothetical protein
MNTVNDIRAAIETRLATEMANSPAYTIAFQNVPFTPPNNTSWVQSSITFGVHESATLQAPTSGYNKHNGELIINVFSPQGVGSGANYIIAERIKDLFHRQTVSQIIFGDTVGPSQVSPASPQPFFQTELSFIFEAWLQ